MGMIADDMIRNLTIEPILSLVTVTVYNPRSSSALPPQLAETVPSRPAMSGMGHQGACPTAGSPAAWAAATGGASC